MCTRTTRGALTNTLSLFVRCPSLQETARCSQHRTFRIYQHRKRIGGAFAGRVTPRPWPQRCLQRPFAHAGGGPPGGAPNMFVRPPVPTFYEGILVLESAKGV